MRSLAMCGLFVLLSGTASPDVAPEAPDSAPNSVVVLTGEISGQNEAVLEVINTLTLDPSAPVVIAINSPGGSVAVGLEVIRAILAHEGAVTCVIPPLAEAASMAALIFDSCDVRVMASTALLMHHRISVPHVEGDVRVLESVVSLMKALEEVGVAIACARSTNPDCEELVISEGWWLSGKQAVANGMADVVIP